MWTVDTFHGWITYLRYLFVENSQTNSLVTRPDLMYLFEIKFYRIIALFAYANIMVNVFREFRQCMFCVLNQYCRRRIETGIEKLVLLCRTLKWNIIGQWNTFVYNVRSFIFSLSFQLELIKKKKKNRRKLFKIASYIKIFKTSRKCVAQSIIRIFFEIYTISFDS